ncbi:hypothetical protein PIB30_082066 [Stylosanthes scabra]|uniref:Gnk2-homologous domain-containing protein n=1 Tax=Stylosanthes scabra TaxID=79078 RepID=A0ABU6SS40_9FABA|nr:hypothetical protein [Stylosanthes scabra]
MQDLKPSITYAFLIIVSTLLLSPKLAASSSDNFNFGDEVFIQCGTTEYPDLGSTKIARIFMGLMDMISMEIKKQGWSTESLINPLTQIFALGECRSDLNSSICLKCFHHAREHLSQCLPKVAGRVFMDGCFLRYDNYSFFNEAIDKKYDQSVCIKSPLKENMESDSNATVLYGFQERAGRAVTNVTETAPGAVQKFAVNGDNKDVFAVAQCWHTLDREGCERCLRRAGRKLNDCIVVNDEGKSMLAGCFLKYSTRKFYAEEFNENAVKESNGQLIKN